MMRRISLSILSFAAVFILLALPASCGGGNKPGGEPVPPRAKEIRKETRKGPFCVRILADKDSPSIAESVILTIEADAPKGYDAQLPRFGEKLGEFLIREYRDEPPRLTADGRIVVRKIYTLDPFLSGDYAIAPMKVTFRKKADTGTPSNAGTDEADPGEHEVESEEITIQVHSLLEKDQKEPTLNPIRGPLALPSGSIPTAYLLMGAVAAVVAGCGAYLFFKRKRRACGDLAATMIPAHELAARQLREILDSGFVERGEIKLFFSKISDVLRSYIENRFGIHAPKRTTEEFLLDISRDAPFPSDLKNLLMEFLRNCDLVKFAEHTPREDEISRAVESCMAFIQATREDLQSEETGTQEKEG